MRITESRLRRVIRQIINESADMRQLTDRGEFYQYLMTGIDKAFPLIVNDKNLNDQTYRFSFYDQGRNGFNMSVNGKEVDQKELREFLEELYYEHTATGGNGWMPLDICLKRMIGFLEAEGLITATTYKHNQSVKDQKSASDKRKLDNFWRSARNAYDRRSK